MFRLNLVAHARIVGVVLASGSVWSLLQESSSHAHSRIVQCDRRAQPNVKSVGHLDSKVFTQSRGTCSAATYPANNPSEDRHNVSLGERATPGKGSTGGWLSSIPFGLGGGGATSAEWNVLAVFDGHGGWQVSHLAQEKLVKDILTQLDAMGNAAKAPKEPDAGSLPANQSVSVSAVEQAGPLAPISRAALTAVDRVVLTAFKSIESEYLQKVRESYRLGFGEVAKVGCCALVALQRGDELIVANAGDCRAVLGSSPSASDTVNGKFLTTRLTHDHNARMPLELLTLQREHPGESDVVVCKTPHACYVKGRLQLTRALGDAYLKYPEFNQSGTHRGRYIAEPYTPPYVKSTPDVHHVKLGANDRFVVLASDGLWDFLSDEDAVAVVEGCLRDGNASQAGDRLVQRALEVAAGECGMTIEQLRALPAGSSRRNRHDDTTAVVLYF